MHRVLQGLEKPLERLRLKQTEATQIRTSGSQHQLSLPCKSSFMGLLSVCTGKHPLQSFIMVTSPRLRFLSYSLASLQPKKFPPHIPISLIFKNLSFLSFLPFIENCQATLQQTKFGSATILLSLQSTYWSSKTTLFAKRLPSMKLLNLQFFYYTNDHVP